MTSGTRQGGALFMVFVLIFSKLRRKLEWILARVTAAPIYITLSWQNKNTGVEESLRNDTVFSGLTVEKNILQSLDFPFKNLNYFREKKNLT